ncbi:unnamed protein product [Camellia sinensis]
MSASIVNFAETIQRCFCISWFRPPYLRRQTPAYLQHPSGGGESVLRKLSSTDFGLQLIWDCWLVALGSGTR